MSRESQLIALARTMMLTPKQAIALPGAITVAARKGEVTEEFLIEACFAKPALAAYVANACRIAAATFL